VPVSQPELPPNTNGPSDDEPAPISLVLLWQGFWRDFHAASAMLAIVAVPSPPGTSTQATPAAFTYLPIIGLALGAVLALLDHIAGALKAARFLESGLLYALDFEGKVIDDLRVF